MRALFRSRRFSHYVVAALPLILYVFLGFYRACNFILLLLSATVEALVQNFALMGEVT